MSSPPPKPVRRGTLNLGLGLRRKSSVASLAPSVNSINGSGQGEEATADDNASISSKTDKRPPKKRMFSILAPRSSKASVPSIDGTTTNGSHTQEPSEFSESGSDQGLTHNGSITGSLGSGLFSSRRSSGGTKIAVEAERKRLEDQVQALTSEKSALESTLESTKAEADRLAAEAAKNAAVWEAERSKIQEESVVRLLEKDAEMKSMSGTVAQLREELARAKAVEDELEALKASAASNLEAQLAEREDRVRETVKEEKEALETKLSYAQTALGAKDGVIRGLETEASGLKEKLTAAEEEVKKLKEAVEGLPKAGGCTIM